jgi:hypothetical protein
MIIKGLNAAQNSGAGLAKRRCKTSVAGVSPENRECLKQKDLPTQLIPNIKEFHDRN